MLEFPKSLKLKKKIVIDIEIGKENSEIVCLRRIFESYKRITWLLASQLKNEAGGGEAVVQQMACDGFPWLKGERAAVRALSGNDGNLVQCREGDNVLRSGDLRGDGYGNPPQMGLSLLLAVCDFGVLLGRLLLLKSEGGSFVCGMPDFPNWLISFGKESTDSTLLKR
ncbi:hypothetical protein L2E82_20707 [Cichorium intybus]|uniref:Uncharacterized protein n=1 Tax=Cichorium intybus TaxID=13427 RepID=A0ACB9DU30_CICIN|nr:hypothetical protein L2E82_20707 [Cichorium intybus]